MPNLAHLSNQDIIYISLIVAVMAVAAYYIVRPNPNRNKKTFGDDQAIWPYQPIPLMTDSEVRFFHLLQEAAPELHIFSQVQLSRIIEAFEVGENAPKHNAIWRSRIAQMSVDFLLVDDDAQTPLVVIELDDWSHEAVERQVADAKKNKALSCAGLPVLRYHGEAMPEVHELRTHIIKALESGF